MRWIKLLTICLILISVTGCVHRTVVIDSYCVSARPIVYEDSDVDVASEKLVDSIVRHNMKYKELCGDR